MKTIAIAIFPGVQALDVAGPVDVFGEANSFVPAGTGYALTIVGADSGQVATSNGLGMVAQADFASAGTVFHTALVAGGPGLPDAEPDSRMTAWLRGVAGDCTRYGSICTGAFALGHAGLLDDRDVTTHWQNGQRLAQRFPRARVMLDRIYARDGALVTSAGITAGIDVALALVAEDHGAKVALAVAKRLVVFAHRRGGQSQFSPYLSAPADDTSPIARVQAYVMEHLKEKFTVARLAEVAGTSPRNFARIFVQSTGLTPHEFLERARVDAARRLLESGSTPLKVVAYESGFGTADRMRLVFQKRIGVSPSDYRTSFLGA